jgi:hypothetical protein
MTKNSIYRIFYFLENLMVRFCSRYTVVVLHLWRFICLYCRVMECEVSVELGRCSLRVGSMLGQSSCPYMDSLVCPLKEHSDALVEAK